jgi:hypothetical protein
MLPKGHNTDLAGLLDGELHDKHEVEQINAAIKADSAMQCEFEDQRSIKSMLGELDEYEAPSFLSTRVMGEINARRTEKRRLGSWKQALSAFGGVFIVAICAMALNGNLNGSPAGDAGMLAETSPGTVYEAAPWTKPNFDESIKDEQLRNFMEFTSDAHRRSELDHVASSDSPNIDDLVLMVGQEGGSH